ncbi:hypothetical protein BDN72DRAFT_846223 [Pluteus cervinus]|uniref:Uncharacterized protein n=1 Tax=Pluteus cervinus TaxID=181527 RepID=A0ACD3AGR0_9AGAR|nr:hypothetical protein BDN72DRAFT_846223 [Pluteus cervinus]
MSHSDKSPFVSTCLILSCTLEQFREIHGNEAPEWTTDTLSKHALTNIIPRHRLGLRAVQTHYHLDELLSAMLEYAPHTLGRRYVAVSLFIADIEGGDIVFKIADAWMHDLFLPILEMYKPSENPYDELMNGDQSPTITGVVNRTLIRQQLSKREQDRCAISRAFDRYRVIELINEGRLQDIPQGVPQFRMKITPIIPPLLIECHGFAADSGLWDMFLSWTQIDTDKVVRSVNTPRNAIYLSGVEDDSVRRFDLYLDETADPDSPNKYSVQMARAGLALSNGLKTTDVEFRSAAESGV